MKRLVKIVAILAGVYVVVMLGSGVAIKALLSGGASEAVRNDLASRFPVEVELGDGDFDLKQWFLLRPAITLQNLAIGNPEGFSDEKMIEAGEISGQVSLLSLLSRKPRVRRIAIANPTVRIETNEYGRNNLASLAPDSSAPEAEPPGEAEVKEATTLAIDAMNIAGGSLHLVDLKTGEDLALEDVEVELTDFSTTSQFNLVVSARPFGGDRSLVSFSGQAGPFRQESFPADGELSIVLAPAEIPVEVRTKALGESLRDPGPGSVMRIETKVSGDLVKTLKGGGTLAFDGFEFGRDAEHRLPIEGDVPLILLVEGALNNPRLNINATDATLALGDGEFEGQLQLAVGSGDTSGSISGSIRDVDIDQMLGTFTESSGQIFGRAAIPQFGLRFRGSGGDELLNSLAGNATMTVEEGRLTFMDTVDRVLKTTGTVLRVSGLARSSQPAEGEAAAPEGQTPFTTLACDASVADRRVNLANIELKSPSGDVTGNGSFTFDSVLAFDMAAHVTGEVADAIGGKPDEQGVIRAAIPFDVSGTFEDPKVRPDVRRVAAGTATRVLEGLLGGQDEEGEEKPSILDIFKKKQPDAQP